jgi:hypothetical protein
MKNLQYKNIGQTFLRISRRANVVSNDFPFHTMRDWVLLFVLSVIILGVTAFYTGRVLLHTLRGDLSSREAGQVVQEILSPEEFIEAVDFLKDRRVRFQELEKDMPSLRDPSLQKGVLENEDS